MKRISIYVIIALILVACGNEVEPESVEEQVVNVKIYEAHRTNIRIPVHCSGKLSTKSESKLAFKVGGIIDQIFVNEGQSVYKGQTLARLNLSEIQAKVDQAKLALEKAERDYERVQKLYEDSVATLEQYQDITTQLEFAKTNLKISNFNLRYSTIQAPSNGKILMKLAAENEVIGSGYPVLLFGSTAEKWVVKTNLSDQQVVQIQMGDSALIYFDAYPGERFIGYVNEIASAADLYTGTYEVELEIETNEFMLKSGFIAKIELIPANKKEGILIPVDAMQDLNNMTGYVSLLKKGEVVKQEVQVSEILDTSFLLKTGINDGDTIITEGIHYIDENCVINILK